MPFMPGRLMSSRITSAGVVDQFFENLRAGIAFGYDLDVVNAIQNRFYAFNKHIVVVSYHHTYHKQDIYSVFSI
jgi:hypothetical protein